MEQVWNLERLMDSNSSIPSIPSIPTVSRAHTGAHARMRAHAYDIIFLVWKVWKVWKSVMNKGSQRSIRVPYLGGGVEGV